VTDLKLLTPYEGPVLKLAHRVAMAPMTRNRAGESRVANDLMATYYGQRRSAALIVTEAVDIAPRAVGYPGTPGWYTDAMKAGWASLVAKVKAEATPPFFTQLFHTGRVSHTAFQPDGGKPIAPSAIAADAQLYVPGVGMEAASEPHPLTPDEIQGVVGEWVAAARAAIAAGFDGVEIGAGNGYLLDQFLRDGSNRRTDAYGGSIDNRMRFLLEVVDAVVAEVGAAKVGVRISPSHVNNGCEDSDPVALAKALGAALSPEGLAYLHMIEDASDQAATRAVRETYAGTLIVNMGYDRASAEAAIASGLADVVAFGRAFLANPDLPKRLELDAPLNAPDPATFYGGTDVGYTDYPTL
jgi:N-ethylmaleimide reductase